jgi:hypothetical protein
LTSLKLKLLSPLRLPFRHAPFVLFIQYQKLKKNTSHDLKTLEVTPRVELGIEDLQSTALPLGHVTFKYSYTIDVFNEKVKIS